MAILFSCSAVAVPVTTSGSFTADGFGSEGSNVATKAFVVPLSVTDTASTSQYTSSSTYNFVNNTNQAVLDFDFSHSTNGAVFARSFGSGVTLTFAESVAYG